MARTPRTVESAGPDFAVPDLPTLRARLSDALLAGRATAPLRRLIAAEEARIAAEASEAAEAEQAAQEALRASVAAAATAMATASRSGLAARLAALQPPPPPAGR